MLEENSSSFVRNYYSALQGKANVYTAKLNRFTVSQCHRNIVPIIKCSKPLDLYFLASGLKYYFLI